MSLEVALFSEGFVAAVHGAFERLLSSLLELLYSTVIHGCARGF